jgi:hypothetical protein
MNRFVRFLAIGVLLGFSGVASAQGSPSSGGAPDRPAPGSAPGAAERLKEAKDLFRKGVSLLQAGDVEAALAYFLRSREAMPSSQNTVDAAICLERLGRYDEALEMYEELVTTFRNDLDDNDRATIGPAMAAVRKKLGTVSVVANVEGTVVLDGRPRGRLPLAVPIRATGGRHILRIVKEGFATYERWIDVTVGQHTTVLAELVSLEPAVREIHAGPHTAKPRDGLFFVEVYGAYAASATLASDAEHPCPARCSHHAVGGGLVGARVGYRLRQGFGVELTGGYASFAATVARTARGRFYDTRAFSETYALADDLHVRGAFVGGGPSMDVRLGRALGPTRWAFVARTTLGVLFASASDPITGSLSVGGASAPVIVENQNQTLRSQPLFVMPAMGLQLRFRLLNVSLALGTAFFPLSGPRFDHAQTGAATNCPYTPNPGTPGCAPASAVVANERAYGPFLLWLPQLSAGLVF